MDDPEEVLATITASAPRRWLAVVSLVFLGVLLIYVALMQPPALGWQVFLLVLGAGALVVADKLRRATARVIELTERVLRDSSGEIIAHVEDILRVDRGVFAFKPSNGFLIRTSKSAGPRMWLPGMWWRLGRMIGVGGVTPGRETKFASDILSAILAKRDDA